MEMQIIEEKDERIIIRTDVSYSLANVMRRAIAEVPVLAVEEVEIFKNDSALYDEMLAHRLGLLVLKTEKSMNSKTKIEFKLSKKGPGTVYAGDLEGPGTVVHPKTPLTILNEGYKLEFVATASLGTGLEHAKYTPGLCYYRNMIEVKSKPEIDKIIQEAKTIVKPEKKGTKWICDLPDADVDRIKDIDESAVSDSNELLFVIESFGQLPAKTILEKSIEAIKGNLAEVEKSIK